MLNTHTHLHTTKHVLQPQGTTVDQEEIQIQVPLKVNIACV